MRTQLWLIGPLALALAACGDDDTHDHASHGAGLDAHACEHLTGGPYADVTAAADAADAVEGFEPHHLTTVELVALPDGQRGGYVQVTLPKSGHFRLMFDAGVPAALHRSDLSVMAWMGTTPPDGCAEGAIVYQVPELEAGTPYLLALGPTDAESVGFVMAHEDHYNADAEGHDPD